MIFHIRLLSNEQDILITYLADSSIADSPQDGCHGSDDGRLIIIRRLRSTKVEICSDGLVSQRFPPDSTGLSFPTVRGLYHSRVRTRHNIRVCYLSTSLL